MFLCLKVPVSNKRCFLQIEREKSDLSVQVIQLVERLEEAEGGAESQVRLTIVISSGS
jgi:hypothetical protein